VTVYGIFDEERWQMVTATGRMRFDVAEDATYKIDNVELVGGIVAALPVTLPLSTGAAVVIGAGIAGAAIASIILDIHAGADSGLKCLEPEQRNQQIINEMLDSGS
jgi:hypothetical protein